jgi:CTP:phosphocholine cytidylyltransferase-like protein
MILANNKELSHLYWNKVLDEYIKTHKMSCEDYEDMSDFQKGVIQELKKYFKRKKACKAVQ